MEPIIEEERSKIGRGMKIKDVTGGTMIGEAEKGAKRGTTAKGNKLGC